ncbi:hypothetical protein FOBRF1_012073 [Fusarium oxysporum]
MLCCLTDLLCAPADIILWTIWLNAKLNNRIPNVGGLSVANAGVGKLDRSSGISQAVGSLTVQSLILIVRGLSRMTAM